MEFAILVGFIGFALLALAVTVLYLTKNKGNSQTSQARAGSGEEAVTQDGAQSNERNMNEGVTLAPDYRQNNANQAEEHLDRPVRELPETIEESQDSDTYQAYPAVRLLRERDRRRQQLGRELQELDRRIKASEGYQAKIRITLLEESYFIFEGNYLGLRHLLNEFEQSATFLKLWDERDSGRLNIFIRNVIRLFHNYLAGAATLLDHTYTFVEDTYGGTSFAKEYQERVNQQFRNSSIPHFVEDLRNYTRHERLAFALAEVSFGGIRSDAEVHSAIKLNVPRLCEWGEWSDNAREYLDVLDDEVRLDDIVVEYASIIIDFYKWFRKRQSELHHESLKELEELERREKHLRQELKRLETFLESRYLEFVREAED